MTAAVKRIGPADLKAWMHDGGETAVLDAREENVFDARHLLFAACMPLGRIETLAVKQFEGVRDRRHRNSDGDRRYQCKLGCRYPATILEESLQACPHRN